MQDNQFAVIWYADEAEPAAAATTSDTTVRHSGLKPPSVNLASTLAVPDLSFDLSLDLAITTLTSYFSSPEFALLEGEINVEAMSMFDNMVRRGLDPISALISYFSSPEFTLLEGGIDLEAMSVFDDMVRRGLDPILTEDGDDEASPNV